MSVAASAILLGLPGLLLLALSCQRALRARLLAAGAAALAGLLLLGAAAVLIVLSANLRSYAHLTHEMVAAQIVFEARSGPRFRATLAQIPSGELQTFMLAGDEWQLGMRLLQWRGWLGLLGLEASYRLEQVSGRYRDLAPRHHDERSLYTLSDNPGLDLWHLAVQHPRWLPFVAATYRSTAQLPMADAARFEIVITSSGLIARPLNEAASSALSGWTPAAHR